MLSLLYLFFSYHPTLHQTVSWVVFSDNYAVRTTNTSHMVMSKHKSKHEVIKIYKTSLRYLCGARLPPFLAWSTAISPNTLKSIVQ